MLDSHPWLLLKTDKYLAKHLGVINTPTTSNSHVIRIDIAQEEWENIYIYFYIKD